MSSKDRHKNMHRFSFDDLLASFGNSDEWAFSDIIFGEQIPQIAERHGIRFGCSDYAIYTVPITLWALLAQVMSKGTSRSCNGAAGRGGGLVHALFVPGTPLQQCYIPCYIGEPRCDRKHALAG